MSNSIEAQPKHDAEELLPWYATGQLEGDELARVEDHLSSCAHCRRQLALERRMIEQFAGLTPDIDNGWARLKRRVEGQQGRASRSPERETGLGGRIAAGFSSLWEAFSRPAVAAIAIAEAAFVAIGGTALYTLSQPAFQTLGSAPAPQPANAIAIFRPDTTDSQMLALLRESGASLVGGPTSTDAYLLRLPQASREPALERLRTDRHVVMAQPIDGAGS